jgi:hypothetical protein
MACLAGPVESLAAVPARIRCREGDVFNSVAIRALSASVLPRRRACRYFGRRICNQTNKLLALPSAHEKIEPARPIHLSIIQVCIDLKSVLSVLRFELHMEE